MPSQADIESQNQVLLQRRRQFRIAAAFVANELTDIAAVRKVVLFGSVALPPFREVPRFEPYRRARIATWHECKDIDLAVWVGDLSNLMTLQ